MSHSFAGLEEVLSPVWRRMFPPWIDCLKKELSECDAVLDLGCGYDCPIRYCKPPFSVGAELFEPYLQESKGKSIHDQYIKADIRKLAQNISRPVIASLIMGGFVWYSRSLNLLLLVLAAIVLYFGLLYITGGIDREDMQLLKQAVKSDKSATR